MHEVLGCSSTADRVVHPIWAMRRGLGSIACQQHGRPTGKPEPKAECVSRRAHRTPNEKRRTVGQLALVTTPPDLSPAKLEELERLWLIEAVKYNVLPLESSTSRTNHTR